MEILDMFKSKWCWLTAILGFGLGAWFAYSAFLGQFDLLRILAVSGFLLLFPVSLTCNVRLLVQRWREARTVGGSLVHMVLYTLGFVAVQSCFVGGFCGVSLGTSLLIFFLPSGAATYFMHNSVVILLIIDIFLFIGLVYMKCFSDENKASFEMRPKTR